MDYTVSPSVPCARGGAICYIISEGDMYCMTYNYRSHMFPYFYIIQADHDTADAYLSYKVGPYQVQYLNTRNPNYSNFSLCGRPGGARKITGSTSMIKCDKEYAQ